MYAFTTDLYYLSLLPIFTAYLYYRSLLPIFTTYLRKSLWTWSAPLIARCVCRERLAAVESVTVLQTKYQKREDEAFSRSPRCPTIVFR